VKRAALLVFGVAAVAGVVLAVLAAWWLVVVGAACLVAAWFYTGGRRPYGYRGLGEVSVFLFFGLVATAGTTFVQAGEVTVASVLSGAGCGALACAILVANNLRDIPTDTGSGKRTLAVRLGDRRTRILYAGLVAAAFLLALAVAVRHPLAAVTLVVAPIGVPPTVRVLRGASGPALVPVLKATGLLLLGYGVVLGLLLALS
jgi:1,4-dihydroxy-2-naphthoate octaprenyltransferase